MEVSKILTIAVSMVFINNFILSKFLGLCPFLGVSKETKSAVCMGLAVIFVMLSSSIITWFIYRFILIPFGLSYLRTITFILVIASFVQFIEMVIKRYSFVLYRTLGIYLPLITTNCAVLGVTILNTNEFFKSNVPIPGSFTYSVFQALFSGLGFMLALIIMSGIRERLELQETPRNLEGVPIAFIVAGILSFSFMGFSGFKF